MCEIFFFFLDEIASQQPATLLKKKLRHTLFSSILQTFKDIFIIEHFQMIASGKCHKYLK